MCAESGPGPGPGLRPAGRAGPERSGGDAGAWSRPGRERRAGGARAGSGEAPASEARAEPERRAMAETKIIYHMDEEETPYLVKLPVAPERVTLADFKNVLSNRPVHAYKFFFKSMDQDFGSVGRRACARVRAVGTCPARQGRGSRGCDLGGVCAPWCVCLTCLCSEHGAPGPLTACSGV